MKNRFLSVIVTLKARDSGPFFCLTEKLPWLQLIDAFNVLDSKFLGRPNMWMSDAGSEVESYKHVDFIFPQRDRGFVVVLAKSEYGEHVLRRALAWVDSSEVCMCA